MGNPQILIQPVLFWGDPQLVVSQASAWSVALQLLGNVEKTLQRGRWDTVHFGLRIACEAPEPPGGPPGRGEDGDDEPIFQP